MTIIQTAQETLRTTLSASAAFQSLTSTGSAAAALARIYHDYLPRPASGGATHTASELSSLRPCAIIWTDDSGGFVFAKDSTGQSTSECFKASGTLHLVLFRDIPTAYRSDPSGADTTWRTIIGDIVEDIAERAESAGYLATRRITLQSMMRVAPEDMKTYGDAQEAHLLIEWGVEG